MKPLAQAMAIVGLALIAAMTRNVFLQVAYVAAVVTLTGALITTGDQTK